MYVFNKTDSHANRVRDINNGNEIQFRHKFQLHGSVAWMQTYAANSILRCQLCCPRARFRWREVCDAQHKRKSTGQWKLSHYANPILYADVTTFEFQFDRNRQTSMFKVIFGAWLFSPAFWWRLHLICPFEALASAFIYNFSIVKRWIWNANDYVPLRLVLIGLQVRNITNKIIDFLNKLSKLDSWKIFNENYRKNSFRSYWCICVYSTFQL